MAFIFPTAMAINPEEDYDAGNEQVSYLKTDADVSVPNRENMFSAIDPNSPLAIWATVEINGINLLPSMPVDCYDINISLFKDLVNPGHPQDCDIKAIMDIFKHEDMPKEEIICFDFEDTWDIYNYWDSVDDTTDSTSGPGGIDTWCRTDVRSNSPSYSFRSTQFDDHYMGNQLDYLMAHIENTGDYTEIIVDFMQICFGEVIDDGDGNDILEDYGWCEYSFDGTTWVNTFDDMETWEEYFWDNASWDSVSLTIPGSLLESDIYFRFAWTSGPTIQNEGWYVDDVCFSGRQQPDLGTLVFTSHSLEEFTITDQDSYWEFPETWCPDEGNYTIRIWLLSETEECEVLNPQADPFIFDVTIGDVLDLAVTYNCIIDPTVQPFAMGDDLLVEGTIENVGTVDATDIPVTFKIKETIFDTPYYELFESGDYPVVINAQGADLDGWHSAYYTGGGDYDEWHVSDDASVSPDNSMTCYNATFGGMVTDMDTSIICPRIDWSTDDPLTIDFLCDLMFEVGPGTSNYHGIYPFLGGDGIGNFIFGLDPDEPWAGGITGSSSGWTTWSFSEWFTANTNYWEFNNNWGGYGELDGLEHWLNIRRDNSPSYTWENLGFGFVINTFDGAVTNTGLGVPMAGVFIDNAKIVKTYAGADRYTEVLIIDELKAETTTDPAETFDVEFEWPDMPTGDFIEEKSVPNDDNDDDNMLNAGFEVVFEIAEVDEDDVKAQDLTESEDCLWHVTTSGYNNYLWCGDEETGTYGDDWNCALTLAPTGSPQEPAMDWSGLSDVYLEFDEYSECLANDYTIIEINPYMDTDSPDSLWYQYQPQLTNLIYSEDFEVPPIGTIVDYVGNGDQWTPMPYMPLVVGPPFSPWFDWYGGDFPQYMPLPGPNMMFMVADSTFAAGVPIVTGYDIGPFDFSTTSLIDVSFEGTFWDWNNVWYTLDIYSDGSPTGSGVFEYDISVFDHTNVPFPPGYAYNSFDVGLFVPPGDGRVHIPVSGFGALTNSSEVYLEFFSQQMDNTRYNNALDQIEIWGSEPTSPGLGGMYGWRNTIIDMRTDNFVHPYSGDTFGTDIGGFTDEMGLRIRFISDSDYHQRGVLLDNIYVHGSGDIFELDECDTLDNFMVGTPVSGDFWTYTDNVDPIPDVWCNEDPTIPGIPHDLNNPLVWETSVPQAMSAALHFYQDYDLEEGDYCYVEFSNDGGSNWVAPVRYSGVGAGYAEIDMSPFVGDNVLIRWRIDTNETGVSDHYCVSEMRISAKIDVNAPITTGTLTGTVIHGWYSTPVTFTATATDDVSGVDAIYYKIDGGATLTYSAPITISVNGEHYIEYWAVDNVGNEEAHHTTPTFQIDTGSSPSVSISAPGDGLYLFGNQILSLSGRTIIIGGFNVQASASDSDSGVFRVQFALDGTIFSEDTTSPFSAYCGEKHTGAGTITVTAEDFTGNTASASKDITYFKFL